MIEDTTIKTDQYLIDYSIKLTRYSQSIQTFKNFREKHPPI